MTPQLRKYLDLERLMLEAEAVDEAVAESIREVMDGVWYALTVEERNILDERTAQGPIRVMECVRLPITAILRRPLLAIKKPYDGKPVSSWRKSA